MYIFTLFKIPLMLKANEEVLISSKPFLRWAGGKSWLTKHLSNIKITNFNNYHEPFLGGASTYFYLSPTKKAFLSDLNKDLIDTYIQVRDNALEVIKSLKTFENSAEYYYEIRSTNFNNANNAQTLSSNAISWGFFLKILVLVFSSTLISQLSFSFSKS